MGAFKMKAQRCETVQSVIKYGAVKLTGPYLIRATPTIELFMPRNCVISDYSYVLTFMTSSKVLLTQIQRIGTLKQLRLFPSTHIFFELKFLDSCLIFLLPHRNDPSES